MFWTNTSLRFTNYIVSKVFSPKQNTLGGEQIQLSIYGSPDATAPYAIQLAIFEILLVQNNVQTCFGNHTLYFFLVLISQFGEYSTSEEKFV